MRWSIFCHRMLVCAAALGLLATASAAPVTGSRGTPRSRSWLERVEADMRDAEYHIGWQDSTLLPDSAPAWHAPNRAQGFRAYFTEQGVRVIERRSVDPDWIWGLSLESYGRATRGIAVDGPSLNAHENRIEYARGAITEWYFNDPKGLKQGFDLAAPPEELGLVGDPPRMAEESAPIFLRLALHGGLSPEADGSGQAIDFLTPAGERVLRYAELVVTDARGARLESWMEAYSGGEGRGVRLWIDDRDAVYPLAVDPLTTSPDWTVDAGQAFARFAASVATAGDVNGDGFADVIIGAPYYDNGNVDEGRVFVYHGSASGLSLTPDWTMEIDRSLAQFGWSAATAGDVNGDGYSDVIVGAPLSSGSQANEGRVWSYHGSASGLELTFDWSVDSDQDDAQLGYSVAPAGDVNGDGYADVIIAAPYFDGGEKDEGRAWVHHGSPTGLSATAAWMGEGDQIDSGFGWSVSPAGDVNGDGYSDVVVGIPFFTGTNFQQGGARIFHGSAAGIPAGPPDAVLQIGQNTAWCGWSVSTAGDVNGDGRSDTLLGCRKYDDTSADQGAVFLYAGSPSGAVTTPAWMAVGPHSQAELGVSVATAGDIDADGYADVILGAPLAENGESDEGMAFVYTGSSTGLGASPIWSTESDQPFSSYGGSVATAGDIDGDGYADVLVGASLWDNGAQDGGRAFMFRGSVDGPDDTPLWTAESDQEDAALSYSVAHAGDVDGDGFGDVVIGAPMFDNGLPDEGRAELYSGSGAGLEPIPSWVVEGGQAGGRFGESVATAGDVNGDGFTDIIIGAPGFSNGETTEGMAFVFHGSMNGPPLAPDWSTDSDQTDSGFGSAVACAGDVNGDGLSDVIVGAPQFTNGESAEGRVFVYHGSSLGLTAQPTWTAEGDQPGAGFGSSVAAAGDTDGDSLTDVLVGAPSYDAGLADRGRAYLYRGNVFGLTTLPLWTADGPTAGAAFGNSVAGAGDVNGDGLADVIVGAPSYVNGQSGEGGAFVFHGTAGGPTVGASWSVESDQADAALGYAVASAGDVNGDGYGDVIVGAPFLTNGATDEGQARVFTGGASGLASSEIWSAEGDQDGANFGWSVGTAGDVDGDGYADLLVGAPGAGDVEAGEGRASVFYGNGFGAYLAVQQRQPDNLSPIERSGASVSTDEFRLNIFGRTPFGRGKVKLQWEVKPYGTPFDGSPTGTTPNWLTTIAPMVPPSAAITELIEGLAPGQPYHWRVRTLYNQATTPYQQFSRWLTVPAGGWHDVDLRLTAEIDLGVDQVDSKDPVFIGEAYSYTIDASNDGPDGIDASIQAALPPDVSLLSALPTQGNCYDDDHVLTCRFGRIESAASATAVVTVLPLAAGSQVNTVLVDSPSATDSDPGNDETTITTLVKDPAVGNRVWEDTNGNGIQDLGESGMANVLVVLYESTGTFVDTAVTDSFGAYQIAALTYSNDYYLRFFPPPGYVATLAGQGTDDELDSDADPFTLETPVFSLLEQADLVRWDAGMIPNCVAPDEPVYIASMSVTEVDEFPILNFLDPNQPVQITGYNVYRSSDPVPPPSTWPLLATDVIDMDEATPNKQWIDTTGDESPSGIWYYKVSGYNHRCPAEGPI